MNSAFSPADCEFTGTIRERRVDFWTRSKKRKPFAIAGNSRCLGYVLCRLGVLRRTCRVAEPYRRVLLRAGRPPRASPWCADPRLARSDDPPQQRVRSPAQPGEDVLRQVTGMIAGLTEVPGPGQRARDGDREDEDELVTASPRLPRARNQREHLQQARGLPVFFFIGAGHGGIGACETSTAAFRPGLIWTRHP
jgi:hypothetical protein